MVTLFFVNIRHNWIYVLMLKISIFYAFYQKHKYQSWLFPWPGKVDLEGFPEKTPGVGEDDGRVVWEGETQPPASCVTLGRLLDPSGL